MKNTLNTIIKNDDITIEQFFDYIKKSDDEKLGDVTTYSRSTLYYLKKFAKYGNTPFFFSANWAGIFGLQWLAYRKMYKLLGILSLPFYFLPVLLSCTFLDNSYSKTWFEDASGDAFIYLMIAIVGLGIIFLIQMFVFVGMSNMLYFKHVRQKINKAQRLRGGVSIKAVLMVIVLMGAENILERKWQAQQAAEKALILEQQNIQNTWTATSDADLDPIPAPTLDDAH